MTIVEPRIRIPAWRSASPKNWSTRPEYTRPMVRPQKRAIAPSEASQSRGTASQPGIREPPSLDHLDLGVGGEQGLGEHVVEREHPQEGDHHRLVDRPPHPGGAP